MIDVKKVRQELNDLDIDIKDAFGHDATNYDKRIIDKAIDELELLQKVLFEIEEKYGDNDGVRQILEKVLT